MKNVEMWRPSKSQRQTKKTEDRSKMVIVAEHPLGRQWERKIMSGFGPVFVQVPSAIASCLSGFEPLHITTRNVVTKYLV